MHPLIEGKFGLTLPPHMNIPIILEVTDSLTKDASVVGGKAQSVAELVAQNAPVPAGFVIPVQAFQSFIEPHLADISRELGTVDATSPASAFDAGDRICELLCKAPIPAELELAIDKRVDDGRYAVRSTATAEDSVTASFAGIYESFLDGYDAKSVANRVKDVWLSYFSGRAISYRVMQGINHLTGGMAVLVMELVDADAGGVVFTRDPRDGSDQLLINVALGLGEGVVSGQAQADSFSLDSSSLEVIRRNVIDKELMFVTNPDGETTKVPVPAEQRSEAALSDENLRRVAEISLELKKRAGDDRDIEFAVRNDEVFVLQSRPITTGAAPQEEFPISWDSPEEEKLHWVTGRPDPLFPLVIDYSFMQGEAEKRSVDFTGQYMGRQDLKKIVNGYLYSAPSPRDPEELKNRLFKHHLQGRRYLEKGTTYFYEEVEPVLRSNLAALEQDRPADDTPIPDHVAYLRRAMRLATDHQNDLHWRSWAGFKEKDDLANLFAEITGRPPVESSDLTLGMEHMTAKLSRRMNAIAALVKSDKWLSEKFAERDYDALFARGNGNNPVVRSFRTRFRSLLKTWGRRNGIGYGTAWKPTDPTWNMRPDIPLDTIGSFVRQDIEDVGRSRKQLRLRRETAIADVRRIIGRDKQLRKKFDFELFRASNHIKMMENHNYLIEQCTFGEYREAIDRAGRALVSSGWLDEADDIFYLRLNQLDDAVAANDYSDLRRLVITARQEWQENSKLDRPDFIGTKPEEKDKPDEEFVRGLSEDGQTLIGEPSSAGQFTGIARVVVTRSSKPPDIKKGEVLVTDNTGPDWVPVFPLIGALVLDTGDNFQHASLITREYGIPCVIQTKEATTHIKDGQMVTVDGTAGTVKLRPKI